ncbi:MAG: ATP synthase subunit I [Pseudomonadales bacterium]
MGQTRSPFRRILGAQAIVTLVASVGLLLFDLGAAMSALLGGAACVVPGAYLLVQSARPDTAAGSGLGRALKGEVGRVAITIAIFAGVFASYPGLNFFAFFGLFAVLQAFYGLVPLLDARRMLRFGRKR